MTQKRRQNPHSVLMVRPLAFSTNAETASDNYFQTAGQADDSKNALAEFDAMVNLLRHHGVQVMVVEETRSETPDAVFPNNWISSHQDGTLVTYPMYAPSRRLERRKDILDQLRSKYVVSRQFDLTSYEQSGQFLEGTGAIVFDHVTRTAFMARSKRADEGLLDILCTELSCHPLVFDAVDDEGRPIYHTNVMMAVGEKTILIGSETISDERQRRKALDALSGERFLIDLSQKQIAEFAGNALEVDTEKGPVLIMSARAKAALRPDQLEQIEATLPLLAPDLATIEKSGGSARCMMAGIHLPPKSA